MKRQLSLTVSTVTSLTGFLLISAASGLAIGIMNSGQGLGGAILPFVAASMA